MIFGEQYVQYDMIQARNMRSRGFVIMLTIPLNLVANIGLESSSYIMKAWNTRTCSRGNIPFQAKEEPLFNSFHMQRMRKERRLGMICIAQCPNLKLACYLEEYAIYKKFFYSSLNPGILVPVAGSLKRIVC